MKRVFYSHRFCSTIAENIKKAVERQRKLDFSQLHHPSKIPHKPIPNCFQTVDEDINVDTKTIQLLERLALVNLDGDGALQTLRSSIQFAKKIETIQTNNKKPLYVVLENCPLYLRNDEVNDGNCRDDILRNAKLIEDDYFISPPGNIPLEQN